MKVDYWLSTVVVRRISREQFLRLLLLSRALRSLAENLTSGWYRERPSERQLLIGSSSLIALISWFGAFERSWPRSKQLLILWWFHKACHSLFRAADLFININTINTLPQGWLVSFGTWDESSSIFVKKKKVFTFDTAVTFFQRQLQQVLGQRFVQCACSAIQMYVESPL